MEALWELRFAPARPPVAELLFGLAYQAIASDVNKVERLLTGTIPPAVLEQDPGLRYSAWLRARGQSFVLSVGERAITVACVRPYLGWKALRERVLTVLAAATKSGLIGKAERFSLKYIDLLEVQSPPSLDALVAKIEIGRKPYALGPTELRTEIREGGFLHLVHIASPATARSADGSTSTGLLVDVDSICDLQGESADIAGRIERELDPIHTVNKKLFFDLLSPDTFEKLEPVYEE